MKDQIKLVGILNIVWGSISLLFALAILMGMSAIAAIVSGSSSDPDAAKAAPIVAAVGFFIAIVVALIGLPAVIGGWALVNLKPWSRIFMIVISVLHLPNIPFGTALGVFGLVVLLKEEARVVLDSGGGAPYYVPPVPPPPPLAPPPPPASY